MALLTSCFQTTTEVDAPPRRPLIKKGVWDGYCPSDPSSSAVSASFCYGSAYASSRAFTAASPFLTAWV